MPGPPFPRRARGPPCRCQTAPEGGRSLHVRQVIQPARRGGGCGPLPRPSAMARTSRDSLVASHDEGPGLAMRRAPEGQHQLLTPDFRRNRPTLNSERGTCLHLWLIPIVASLVIRNCRTCKHAPPHFHFGPATCRCRVRQRSKVPTNRGDTCSDPRPVLSLA